MWHEIKIPKRIRIGGFVYKFRLDKRAHDDLEAASRWGQHGGLAHTIDLDRAANPDQFSKSALHELLHGVDHVYNGDKLSEEAIQNLSQGLFQVFEQLKVRFVK